MQNPFDGKIVYIAGPMTGLPDYNRAAFFAAEVDLKKLGAKVLNPAYAPDGLQSHASYMRIALAMVAEAECMFVLDNWHGSKGVAMEMDLAGRKGIPIEYQAELSKTPFTSTADTKTNIGGQVGGDHYNLCAIQPVEYIEANQIGFLEGCVIKRLSRHNKPTGKGLQDIDKSIHELRLLRELRYEKAEVS
jgi:hypothetical protein